MSGSSSSHRVGVRPGEVINRHSPVSFTWDGRQYTGFEGDTITSALAANGVRVFSRSFKYHRARGILTASYIDPGCTVQVGDEPNVRGSHRRIHPGMQVSPQNVWPSLERDAKSVNQVVGRFLSAGFYYKTFIKPQRLWPAYDAVLRRFSSGGEVSTTTPHDYHDKRYAHPDVLVAGGGPAGMSAALAAADAGARVMLVEEEPHLGGHLRYGGVDGLTTMTDMRAAVEAHEGIEVLTDSVVAARYDDNWIAVVQRGLTNARERLIKARAGALVVAPGLIERPLVFENNDLPGVLLSTAAQRLTNLYAVRPGERAVVLTANDSGRAAAESLTEAGVEVVDVVDATPGGPTVQAVGRGQLRGVRLGGRTIDCDTLVTATGWTTPSSLLNMAGDRPAYDEAAARFVPDTANLPDDVLACGGVVGHGSIDQIVEHASSVGRRAAAVAARTRPWGAHGAPGPDTTAGALPDVVALELDRHPALFTSGRAGFVDMCEDVQVKEIEVAVAEGYDSAELAKRYTTSTMGPTQGKLEVVNTVALIAELTGRTIQETGTTTWRPPYAPITLGALAGRQFEPVRYSPMQPWHEAHGAHPLVAGAWIRPEHYGDPDAEVRAVREGVGIIDVTPIGKLDLRGPDVPKLLNLLYVNKWSKLALGKVRYGVMCAEDGVVMDDGVTGHLGEDHYLMSTTSSGAASVWEWAENWLQTEHPDWQVAITPVTTAYASINVAGPRSRELMRRLVEDVDLEPGAFGYMEVRRGRVAGVDDCVLWRIGFTGELSYELHVPASYGLHVWEQLLDKGADLGVRAFGVEAQRVLRLEKGHLIVGQDTDGLTQGFSAGLDWAIKLDKDDFVGKPELQWQYDRGPSTQLVGLVTADPEVVPEEASQIVDAEGEILGRVTSSRRSPTLGRSICLAQLETALATDSAEVSVRLRDGSMARARVSEQLAQVDPDGTRLRT